MKTVALALLVSFIASMAFAASVSMPPLPKDAILRGRFAQDRMTPGFTAPLHSTGAFIVAPARGVIWHTQQPFDTTMIVTPSGVAQDVGAERTMALPASRVPFLAHLYGVIGGVMAGDTGALDKDFIVTKTDNARRWTLRAVPRHDDPSMPFIAIEVGGGKMVDRVVLDRADGGRDTIAFTDQTVSTAPLSSAERGAFNSLAP